MGDRKPWHNIFLRIGHSGAGAYAPPNTLKSLALALELGVDMVEFDVRTCRDELILLHDDDLSAFLGIRGLASQCSLEEIRALDAGDGEQIPTLTEAIDLVKGRALMNIDLKGAGYEADVLDVLREKSVMADVLISSVIPDSLREVRQLAPAVKTGISYPEDPANATKRPYLQPAVKVTLKLMRHALPYRVLGMMAYARADAAMLHRQVVSVATLNRVHQAEGHVFAWTVDNLSEMRQIRAMGVDGIASNRPDLFAQLGQ